MKVSEKSLELNVGHEVLLRMRNDWGMPKAYLRGLTQAEEKQEGVDFFAQLSPNAKIFAFQFKAPRGTLEVAPYKYQIQKEQHDLLYQLAQVSPFGVFYVFPYYVTLQKLQKDVPNLMQDTWLLNINQMPTGSAFGSAISRTVQCIGPAAFINPEYKLERLHDMRIDPNEAVPAPQFRQWYGAFRERRAQFERRGNPWLVRGLRIAIVQP